MQHPRRPADASRSQPEARAHDVFLSHSGAQKGFVKDLYDMFTSYGFHPFLDVKYHSLPLAESFPQRIFAAASTCKLARVVLSHEYLSSKWPMVELCTFMHATPAVKILPLFFHLSPSDLKKKGNQKQWYSKWKSFAKVDHRIKVCEWKEALKSLCSLNGITYRGAALEGEHTFIERILEGICISETLVPQLIYDTSYMQGKARFHQIILDKFKKMESGKQGEQPVPRDECLAADLSTIPSPPQMNTAYLLGVYGLPGSGKSTLCRSLQGHFFSQYLGRSIYMELPSAPSSLVDAISRAFNLNTSATHIDQVMASLENHQLWRNSIFLAVDNICEESCAVVRRVLRYVIGPGSRVVMVARTLDLLRPALVNPLVGNEHLNCVCESMPMPSINEEEATNLLLETTRQGFGILGPDQLDLMRQNDKVMAVVRMCGFSPGVYPSAGLKYLPLVVKTMGTMLFRYGTDVDGWAHDQGKFWSSFSHKDLKVYKEEVVQMLILENFNALHAQLRLLFLDVALFLLPSQPCGLDEACFILGCMHGEDVAVIRKLLKDLKRLCFIDRLCQHVGVIVHDVYVEFAKSMQKRALMHWSYMQNRDIHWDT